MCPTWKYLQPWLRIFDSRARPNNTPRTISFNGTQFTAIFRRVLEPKLDSGTYRQLTHGKDELVPVKICLAASYLAESIFLAMMLQETIDSDTTVRIFSGQMATRENERIATIVHLFLCVSFSIKFPRDLLRVFFYEFLKIQKTVSQTCSWRKLWKIKTLCNWTIWRL